jgi:NADH:ubiquinone oxidoreductase subunit
MSFLRGLFGAKPKRVLVGTDKVGNKYFLCDKVREIETATRDPLVDVHTHALWQSWLRHRRDTPPTEADIDSFDAKMRQLRINVEEIERKDRKLRLQERAQKRDDQGGDDDEQGIVPFQFGSKKVK